MAKIKLAIVDSAPDHLEDLRAFLAQKEEIDSVETFGMARDALDYIDREQVDLLITDIILPEMDGFELLEELASGIHGTSPRIIVLSAISDETLIRQTFELGVSYYMVKPFTMDVIYKRILDLTGLRPGRAAAPQVASSVTMDERITGIFLSIGIPAHIKGYQYLRHGIKLAVETPGMINSITKKLYPAIAEHFKTSDSKVERAIRHAIDVAWSRGRIENLNQFFGYPVYSKNDKPTNGEFIALIADKLLMENVVA